MFDPWRITLFGGLGAQHGEQVITRFKTQKVASLFAYLALHRLRASSRDELIDAVWPEEAPAAVDSALSALVSKLRKAVVAVRKTDAEPLRTADRVDADCAPHPELGGRETLAAARRAGRAESLQTLTGLIVDSRRWERDGTSALHSERYAAAFSAVVALEQYAAKQFLPRPPFDWLPPLCPPAADRCRQLRRERPRLPGRPRSP